MKMKRNHTEKAFKQKSVKAISLRED